MILTMLSAVFGGLLRLAPEVLKWLGQKDQNAHELAMQDKQLQFLQVQGKMKTDEIQLQGNIDQAKAQVDAIVALNAQQTQVSIASGWLIAAINALVRPSITFFVFGLWGVHKVATMLFAYHMSGDVLGALMGTWTDDDASMLSMILSFFFIGRVWDKRDGK